MFKRITNEESGIALVTAVVVSLVILLLLTVVLQVSIHNVERSADDRRRVQAVQAGEAGIDYYFSYLTETGGQAIKCGPITKTLPGSPGSFTVQAFFFGGETGTISIPCDGPPVDGSPTLNAGTVPTYVTIHSEGRSATATPVRKIEARAKLTVTRGSTFDNRAAIFAENSVNFTSNARLGGAQYSDADIYSNGNYSLAANSSIFGSVFAQGSVTLGSNSEVKKQVWAGLSVTMNTRSSIGKGLGGGLAAASSTQSINLASPSTIYGDAKAQGTISGGTVTGSRNPGQASELPPSRPFPTFSYCESGCTTSPTTWTDAGYTIAPTFSGATACTDAENYIRTTWTSGSLLVRIAAPGSTCTTTFGPNRTYNVYGNLAIISDGPITLATNARFVPSPSSATYNVFVFAGLSGVAPCNFTANANSGFNPGLSTLLYVPSTCTIDLLSNSSISQGQMIGGTINFKHTVAMNFQPITVPGTGIGGFKQDVHYKREIRPS